MKQDLLSFVGQAGVVDDVMLMSMNGDVVERKGSIWSSDS
jgi:hypothetical protein